MRIAYNALDHFTFGLEELKGTDYFSDHFDEAAIPSSTVSDQLENPKEVT